MSVSSSLKDLLADELIQVGRVNSKGDKFYVLTDKGEEFLEDFIEFQKNNPFRFKVFEALKKDNMWPSEKEFAEGEDS